MGVQPDERNCCSVCGTPLNPDDAFCIQCGTPVAQGFAPESVQQPVGGIVCSVCGAVLNPDDAFCIQCGTPVGGTAPVSNGSASPVAESTDSVCANCGAPLYPGDTFCMQCGAAVQSYTSSATEQPASERVCAVCGAPLGAESAFCIHCGTPVSAPASAPIAEPEPTTEPLSETPVFTLPGQTCSDCGAVLEPGFRYCIACGAPVPEFPPTSEAPQPEPKTADKKTKVCSGCGATVDADVVLCPHCNHSFDQDLTRCPQCGGIMDLVTKRCNVCGYAADAASAAPKEAPAPTPSPKKEAAAVGGGLRSTVKNREERPVSAQTEHAKHNFKKSVDFDN